jgi:hypothetical protein
MTGVWAEPRSPPYLSSPPNSNTVTARPGLQSACLLVQVLLLGSVRCVLEN